MRCTRANIDLNNLIFNYRNIATRCKNRAICAAVKADAYGHGAVEVSKALEQAGCNYLGVATSIEGAELVKNGIKSPIILLSLPTPEEIETIVYLNLEPVVTTITFIQGLEKEALKKNKSLKVHLKIDTGMGRIGAFPEDALTLASYIEHSSALILQGVCTHLSTAEQSDQEYTNRQIKRFKDVIERLKSAGIAPPYIHAANSGAILMNDDALFNMVRTGINLYGYPPTNQPIHSMELKPVMELLTKVVALRRLPTGRDISYGRTYRTSKETLIATLPVGYADGYFRALSNRGHVMINGREYPIVGNICMDQMMVKVDKNVHLYDDVTLIGRGKNEPNAESLAKLIGTISYEILTNIHRVIKYYIV